MVNDKLVYREEAKVKKDKSICKKYNHAFQNIYKWIKRTLDIERHDKAYFKQELDKERNREYGRVIGLAKTLNVHVMMNTSYNQLARFTLSDYKNRRHTITSGDCDKVIAYLKEIKKTNTVCKKGVE